MILVVFFNLFSFWFTFSKKHLKHAKPSHTNNTSRTAFQKARKSQTRNQMRHHEGNAMLARTPSV